MFDIVSVGNLSIDSIFLPTRGTPFVVLGGAVAYVSLASRRLGARAAIMSKAGNDFPEAYRWWLEQEGIDLSLVRKDNEHQTTRFDIEYSTDLSTRVLRLKNRALPIVKDEVSQSLKARAIHLAPIAGEISGDLVENLRTHTEILSIDTQGLVRSFEENGNVTYSAFFDKQMLESVDIYKSSLKEIEVVTGMPDAPSAIKAVRDLGVKIVIVTLGAKGAMISVENTVHEVPAYEPQKLVDPTGAGDAFIGGFLNEYAKGEDCSWCSYVGSAVASTVVEGIGPTHLGDRQEIYRRAEELYEKAK